jgi:hypothetical protein
MAFIAQSKTHWARPRRRISWICSPVTIPATWADGALLRKADSYAKTNDMQVLKPRVDWYRDYYDV